MPPTITQQRGLAYAPIPLAIISCVSSGYVIYYLLCKERQKLKWLYHRLVLAMNFALLLLSIAWVLKPFAVPEGTLYHVGASGTIQTCTANGMSSCTQLYIDSTVNSLSQHSFFFSVGRIHSYNAQPNSAHVLWSVKLSSFLAH